MVDIMKRREEGVEKVGWELKMRGECCQGKDIFPVIFSYSRILQTLKIYSSTYL